jgi:hypothetical protein
MDGELYSKPNASTSELGRKSSSRNELIIQRVLIRQLDLALGSCGSAKANFCLFSTTLDGAEARERETGTVVMPLASPDHTWVLEVVNGV